MRLGMIDLYDFLMGNERRNERKMLQGKGVYATECLTGLPAIDRLNINAIV